MRTFRGRPVDWAAWPRIETRGPDGPAGQQAQPQTGEAEATPVTTAPTTQVSATALTTKRRTIDRRSTGAEGTSFIRTPFVLVAGAVCSRSRRIGVRASGPAELPATDARSCRPGACVVAARAAEALRQGPVAVTEAGPVVARELVGHLRSALALDLDCHLGLSDATSPVVALLRSEAGAANPPWGRALVDSLVSAALCLGRSAHAVAELRAGGGPAEPLVLLVEAEELWAEAHGGGRVAAASWDAARAAAGDTGLGPGERIDAVAAALGGPLGMLVALLAGRPPARPDVRVGLPLVEHRVSPEGELAVLELRAVPGRGGAFPSPEMVLIPTDAGFRAAVGAGVAAGRLPDHLDAAWTVRTGGRVLVGESVGAAVVVGVLAVAGDIRLLRPDVVVAGGVGADGTLRSLAGESMPVYAAKLSVGRRVVVPAVDRSALRAAGLVGSGVRFAVTGRDALRLVRRERWRAPFVAVGAIAVAAALFAGVPPRGTGRYRPTATTVVTGATVTPGSGSISGAVQVRVASPRALTVAGDVMAATDGSRLTVSDLAGEAVRTFQLPAAPVSALGFDGTAFWAVAGDQLHRFTIAGQRPTEWIRPLVTSPWPLGGFAPRDSAHDGAGLWVADGYDVVRVDDHGRETARFRATGRVSGVAFDGRHLWLAEDAGPLAIRLRQVARDGTEVRSLPTVLKSVAALDWRDGELWAAVDAFTEDRSWIVLRIRP